MGSSACDANGQRVGLRDHHAVVVPLGSVDRARTNTRSPAQARLATVTDESLAPADLLRRVHALRKGPDGQLEDLLTLMERHWPVVQLREPSKEDAESCRLAMLASYELKNYRGGSVWRVRALLKAVTSGWMHGVIVIVQTEALRIQGQVNDDLPLLHPDYRVAQQALDIYEEIRPYAGSGGSIGLAQPSPRMIGRLYHDKLALMALAQGQYDEAMELYDRAIAFTEGEDRGPLLIAGGQALCRYLAADGEADETAAIDATRALSEDADSAGQLRIRDRARENVQRMLAGRRDLVAYDTL